MPHMREESLSHRLSVQPAPWQGQDEWTTDMQGRHDAGRASWRTTGKENSSSPFVPDWMSRLWFSMPENYRSANWNTLPYYGCTTAGAAYALLNKAPPPLAWRPWLSIVAPGAIWGAISSPPAAKDGNEAAAATATGISPYFSLCLATAGAVGYGIGKSSLTLPQKFAAASAATVLAQLAASNSGATFGPKVRKALYPDPAPPPSRAWESPEGRVLGATVAGALALPAAWAMMKNLRSPPKSAVSAWARGFGINAALCWGLVETNRARHHMSPWLEKVTQIPPAPAVDTHPLTNDTTVAAQGEHAPTRLRAQRPEFPESRTTRLASRSMSPAVRVQLNDLTRELFSLEPMASRIVDYHVQRHPQRFEAAMPMGMSGSVPQTHDKRRAAEDPVRHWVNDQFARPTSREDVSAVPAVEAQIAAALSANGDAGQTAAKLDPALHLPPAHALAVEPVAHQTLSGDVRTVVGHVDALAVQQSAPDEATRQSLSPQAPPELSSQVTEAVPHPLFVRPSRLLTTTRGSLDDLGGGTISVVDPRSGQDTPASSPGTRPRQLINLNIKTQIDNSGMPNALSPLSASVSAPTTEAGQLPDFAHPYTVVGALPLQETATLGALSPTGLLSPTDTVAGEDPRDSLGLNTPVQRHAKAGVVTPLSSWAKVAAGLNASSRPPSTETDRTARTSGSHTPVGVGMEVRGRSPSSLPLLAFRTIRQRDSFSPCPDLPFGIEVPPGLWSPSSALPGSIERSSSTPSIPLTDVGANPYAARLERRLSAGGNPSLQDLHSAPCSPAGADMTGGTGAAQVEDHFTMPEPGRGKRRKTCDAGDKDSSDTESEKETSSVGSPPVVRSAGHPAAFGDSDQAGLTQTFQVKHPPSPITSPLGNPIRWREAA